jgi:hypothetical protein
MIFTTSSSKLCRYLQIALHWWQRYFVSLSLRSDNTSRANLVTFVATTRRSGSSRNLYPLSRYNKKDWIHDDVSTKELSTSSCLEYKKDSTSMFKQWRAINKSMLFHLHDNYNKK